MVDCEKNINPPLRNKQNTRKSATEVTLRYEKETDNS